MDSILDDFVPATTPPATMPLIQAANGIAPHVLAGVKALRRWDDLFPVTAAELDAAVLEFHSITLG